MSRTRSSFKYVATIAALVLLIGGTASGATVSTRAGATFFGCVAKGGALTMTSKTAKCPKGAKKITWNRQGPTGSTGIAGIQGAVGPQGPAGPTGVTNHTTSEESLTLASPGFTSLFSVHLAGLATAGGSVTYTVTADDGGSQIATEHGTIQWLATANSITCTVQTTDKLHLGTVNSGCTPGFFNPGSQPGLSIFDNVTFSSPAPIVHHTVVYTIVNDSDATIRLEP